jgi:hypothetical protein
MRTSSLSYINRSYIHTNTIPTSSSCTPKCLTTFTWFYAKPGPERGLPLLMTLLALAYKDVGALVPATSEQRRFERPKTALSAESSNIQRKPLFCAFDEVPLELATIIIGHLIEYDLAPTFHSEYTE